VFTDIILKMFDNSNIIHIFDKNKYMNEIINLTDENFNDVVLKSDRLVLVDFWAAWCSPCRMVAPILDEIAAERDDVLIAKYNIDDNALVAANYGVRNIPTVLFFMNGNISDKQIGAAPKKFYVDKINNLIV
jgi:thioredoxin 1